MRRVVVKKTLLRCGAFNIRLLRVGDARQALILTSAATITHRQRLASGRLRDSFHNSLY